MKWVTPKTYENPIYPFKYVADLDAKTPQQYQVVIIGAGPVGLTAALDLANRGIPSVIITKEKTVSVGSRALCFAKKTLEIVNRINQEALNKMLQKGITWNLGKVFYKDDEVYKFNLLPEEGHKVPAFINLQQYYFEEYLVDKAHQNPLVDVRWHSQANFVEQDEDKVVLDIQTPKGNYKLHANYVLACDGVHSPTREAMGIPYEGELFEENFLIADIVMENDFPTERWFWFDPPFNKGQSALLHKEPDGVWRIDLQLGWEGVDKDKELDQERIKKRLRAMLGEDCKFELEWTSIYNFRCMRIAEMVHDRVIFLGDSAHQVSPFGARGANGGVQDTDNLIWKLAYVLQGKAPKSLLNSYQEERSPAANENIYHSSNATDFISPKSVISTMFRNQTLDLAKEHPFARQLVNSGRLSKPYKYLSSNLITPDAEVWEGNVQPGCAFSDVQLEKNGETLHLIDQLSNDFTVIVYGDTTIDPSRLLEGLNIKVIHISEKASTPNTYIDTHLYFKDRYAVDSNSWYVIRPDHYIAARGKSLNYQRINNAIRKAIDKLNDNEPTAIIDKNAEHLKDEMYKLLIATHEGLREEESHALNARLVLFMMNEVQDINQWNQLLESAKHQYNKKNS